MESNEFIIEINGKYSIERVFNDKKYNFGIYDNYEEALEKLEYLEEEGWPIPKEVVEKDAVIDGLGLSLNNIEEKDGKFIIYKFIMGEKVIFGEFDSIDEAKQIRNNLIDNAWESYEPNTRSKYGKYILKDNNRFIVKRTYKGSYHIFGYFKTLDDAIECREELVSTNWGDLNIPLQMGKAKYISYNGIMYTIQKMVDGNLHVYGFFNEYDDAVKQRDWLVANNWSRLEVPDDSRRHIHKQGDEYLVYRRMPNDLEYYGTYSTLEDAKHARNKLVETDWAIEDKVNVEKISDFVYFDGEFYTIENEIDGQRRMYGVYKNKNQAILDEKSFIASEWDSVYTIPTKKYPYGENIVPFDYIFILEKLENGVPKELGRYYSFKDVVAARNELFGNVDDKKDRLIFSVKIGKSYKNRGWALIRDSTYDLVPKLPYEDDCDIIVDGISTKGRLNLLPRIFYNKTSNVVDHLENLAKVNPEGRINVELLLNKNSSDSSLQIESLNNNLHVLKKENSELKEDISELKQILTYMDEENNDYSKKFSELNKIMQELDDIDEDEFSSIGDVALRVKIFDLISQVNSIKEIFDI